MSVPRSTVLDSTIRATTTQTQRGDFATLTSVPRSSGLARGSVLLIPGFTGSKEDFGELLPLLAVAGWSAASYDQRGQYETPAAESDDFSLEGFAADAAAVCAGVFGDAEAVHLVGHSFGGLVAGVAAVTEPQRWASLTLLCSGPGGFTGSKRAEASDGADLIVRDGLEVAYRVKSERDADRRSPVIEPEIEEFLHRRFLANSAPGLAAIARHLADAPDRTGDLAALAMPVTVLRGENDDAWPHEVQDALAEAVGTKLVVVPDAAHSPAVEQAEATRDALVRIWMG